ncbi:DUF4235 domain-containing protein [Catenulispora yoronensis]|uniref:DUF4235 domain-containing protein n=1 Tax=Catenulispora yoronensis TaxID=450799 RepID=A0ABN2TV52_9ACTN
MKPRTAKIVYKPVGFGLSLAAGAVASILTRQIWQALTHRDTLPEVDDADTSWSDLLLSTGLEAAIFAVAKTSAQRLKLEGMKRAVSS